MNVLFVALLVGISSGANLGCGASAREEQLVRDAVKKQVEGKRDWRRLFRRNRIKAVVDERDVSPMVRTFYRERKWKPVWVTASGPTSEAKKLAEVLGGAGADGLSPADYDVKAIAAMLDSLDPGLFETRPPASALARLDLTLTREYFQYATHRFSGRVDPRRLPARWYVKPRRQDLVPVIERAVESGRIEEALAGLDPKGADYAALRAALGRFASIVETGGWRPIPSGPLRLGSRGPAVVLLRARLAATGELSPERRVGDVFDREVEAAVKQFQVHYGLEPTGRVEAEERAALNLPAIERYRQVAIQMEKWRWLQEDSTARVLIVNIPAYSLRVREGAHTALAMRVVVGKEFTPTPIFFDKITHVTLNPPWNVPASIVENEIEPALQADPSYLERNGMQVLTGENGERRIQQLPGEGNALGRIKFEMPNELDIYLHDTPARHLFAAADRSFSHGCIRVEKPLELATLLLSDNPKWSQAAIEDGIGAGETRSIALRHPIPVRIVYNSVWVDADGGVNFRDDVYGLDAKIESAWAGTLAAR